MVITVMPTATTTPANQPSMLAPGLIAAASATSPPLSTSAAPPSVSTLSGSARRLRVGHTSALSAAAMTAVTNAPEAPWTSKSGKHRAEQEQGAPVQKQDHQAADGESPEPGHARQPHPRAGDPASPAAGDDASPERSLASRATPDEEEGRWTTPRRSRRSGGCLAVLGVASLVCGVLAIAYPDITLLAVGIIFGFYLLMAGVFELVEAIVGDPASRALSAIVGVVALHRRPDLPAPSRRQPAGARRRARGVPDRDRRRAAGARVRQRRASRLGAARPRSSTSSWASSSSPGPTRASSRWPSSSASR